MYKERKNPRTEWKSQEHHQRLRRENCGSTTSLVDEGYERHAFVKFKRRVFGSFFPVDIKNDAFLDTPCFTLNFKKNVT